MAGVSRTLANLDLWVPPMPIASSHSASSQSRPPVVWGRQLGFLMSNRSSGSMSRQAPGSGPDGILQKHLIVCNAHSTNGSSDTEKAPATEAEKAGWEKRKEESKEAGTENEVDSWQWTLNWDAITPNILVGSCPRSAGDVDRMVDEAGVDAVLNLQSDLCFEALEIPFDSIRERGLKRGVHISRVPIRDFDHGDQALMLPEAVRALNFLLTRYKKVYVHCTAGINRANLAVVGYLTFVQGMSVEEAVKVVKGARKQAHPYIDCWQVVRKRLLDGRDEQLTVLSSDIYKGRCAGGVHGNMQTDWRDAQISCIAETFRRYLEVDTLRATMVEDLLRRQLAPPASSAPMAAPKKHSSSGNGASHNGISTEKYLAEDGDDTLPEEIAASQPKAVEKASPNPNLDLAEARDATLPEEIRASQPKAVEKANPNPKPSLAEDGDATLPKEVAASQPKAAVESGSGT